MDDDLPHPPKPIKFKADGTPDGRGHAEGSKSTRFAHNDGRKRPGRTKGAISLKTAYVDAASRPVRYMDPKTGRRSAMPTLHAIALKQRELALKGDDKATRRFEERTAEFLPEQVDPLSTAKLLEEDAELLVRAFARKTSGESSEGGR